MADTAIALFAEPGPALAAARKLQGVGIARPELLSPIPVEGIEEVLGENPSAIKRFTFFGAIAGGLCGFLLAAGTAVLYLHPVGGRPIITIPPYLIISYEMTILFGILATVAGFFVSARLPALRNRAYAVEASIDKFVVAAPCDSTSQAKLALQMLTDAGATQVWLEAETDTSEEQ